MRFSHPFSVPSAGRWFVLGVVLAAALLAACAEATFDANAAGALLNATPMDLRGEQVVIEGHQIGCGERDGLWNVSSMGGGLQIGRLTDEARALGFSDNVQIGGKGVSHVQVNGTFPVRTRRIESFEDQDVATKILTAELGVIIDHNCFEAPLAVMGVRRGEFRADYSPMFRFQMVAENQWTFDRLIH